MPKTGQKDTLEKCLERVQALTALINEAAGCRVSAIDTVKSLDPGFGSAIFRVDFDFSPESRSE
jgi:hypothetical protein